MIVFQATCTKSKTPSRMYFYAGMLLIAGSSLVNAGAPNYFTDCSGNPCGTGKVASTPSAILWEVQNVYSVYCSGRFAADLSQPVYVNQACADAFTSGNLAACNCVPVPTPSPSKKPTARPTTKRPTRMPNTAKPSKLPSGEPTNHPTTQPTLRPTGAPTVTPCINHFSLVDAQGNTVRSLDCNGDSIHYSDHVTIAFEKSSTQLPFERVRFHINGQQATVEDELLEPFYLFGGKSHSPNLWTGLLRGQTYFVKATLYPATGRTILGTFVIKLLVQ